MARLDALGRSLPGYAAAQESPRFRSTACTLPPLRKPAEKEASTLTKELREFERLAITPEDRG
ncbi:MAG: hypothetical protein JO232_10300 [Verrucomicrobia bacterium]|nr:hypothetical protein [Verrucomicrobiota bacterium]